jgi:hypothetical protein
VADPASVFVVVGISGVVHADFDAPVATTEREDVFWRGMLWVATGQHIDRALLLVPIAQVMPMPTDQRQLRREWKAEGFGFDRAALDFPCFDPSAAFFNRARLRGKRPPAAAGVQRGPAASAGFP